jgi:3-polyprenyl-4-hydroxybenzoate decarboxylase
MLKSDGLAITVGITGASGALYARSLVRLLDADRRVARIYLVVTDAGLRLLSTELNVVAASPPAARWDRERLLERQGFSSAINVAPRRNLAPEEQTTPRRGESCSLTG